LLKPRLYLGRDRSCDVPISFPSISSRHCRLEFRDGFWHVEDLGSSNGTRINGALCKVGWLLTGDELALSRHRYRIVYTAPPGKLPPAEPGAIPGTRLPQAPAAPPRPGRVPAFAGSGTLGCLVPCGGGDAIALRKTRVIVGRRSDCDVVLKFCFVSGRHCQLDLENGRWRVRDLASRNGIRVDGKTCQENNLPPGCVLSVGGLRFRVLYEVRADVPARPGLFDQGLLEKAGLSRTSLAANRPKDEQTQRIDADDL
jgi:pSer/pThr/pTyr-binding forkhead associated (FHA) protein